MNDKDATVYLVDDDHAVLKAISRLLRAEGLRAVTFHSPEEFFARCDGSFRGCLVLDVAMPGLDGLELQQALVTKGCSLPIIFLSGHGDIPMSVKAMKRGAMDFLSKPVDGEALLKAIREALNKDAAQADIRARLATLTQREREVLEHVVSGQMNKNIAADLGTVEKTIKVHRARIMEKMQVQSLAELVRIAERAGIRG